MGLTYTIKNQSGQYFITCTVHQWADVFTRREYADILLDSIRFCQQRKGLLVHCWVLMNNHLHMIVSSDQGRLSDTLRDFKKFTASKIVKAIEETKRKPEKLAFMVA